MPAQRLEQWVKPGVDEPSTSPDRQLVIAVVGFDGSQSAYRALDSAARLISGRTGIIVAVYVGHVSAPTELSPEGLVEVLKGFDVLEREFNDAIRSRLSDAERRWRLERRNGNVALELVAAADQASRDYGADATIVIVVGSAMRSYHRVVGSVPVALVRQAKYPTLVVP
ncbi:MAG: putative universal stress protein [Acidimicrobiaceae bacterium]|nr:putative universal stress protein [Acidimicrobiaceae bacterium]